MTVSWEELMSKKEDLHPELKECLDTVAGIPSIRHPLLYSLFHHEQMNALVNHQYSTKKSMVEKAKVERDWSRYVWMHERPYRFHALAEISSYVADDDFWNIFSDVWIDSENLWQCREFLHGVLVEQYHGDPRQMMMEEEDKKAYEQLPEKVTIYRGCSAKNRKGFSWTLDEKIAIWFAQRFSPTNPLLLTAEVSKKDIVAVLLGRKEKEVVYSRCRLPKGTTETRLKGTK